MKNYFSTDGLKEVYPEELGRFHLFHKVTGKELTHAEMQEIFNAPVWKSYYINGIGRFVFVDVRTGKSHEYKIVQVLPLDKKQEID